MGLSVLLAELVNANEPKVLLFLLIRWEVRRALGAAGYCLSRAHGQVTLLCWDPAGDRWMDEQTDRGEIPIWGGQG